ncbi:MULTISPECIES: NAD(P) transhydrogenase subunit alpha [unclassified Achromobacter]|uniref:NAD(P) transhydrogenase subunit alpha n=1 Tax=unclassified Achromobacter TaxID=2626865 RepID=UPI000B51B7C7|nr:MULTISPECIES: NAD(P) transhydrogenase subunit alpha [unclassified Achromobacter]OWT68113.1 NAD(P)(+) transhydrogenase (Re/Si-specific) subunit alpha [Achromobacter sp. HZ34]OWT69950.1 NAD(P)(+) transhydrogenase (Re/Si-specific) subunit alpha [Achromobacter sp. HZ28]
MTLRIAVLRQLQPGERRVALVPSLMPKLNKLGVELWLETGAGLEADFPDAAYSGARVESDRAALLAQADIVLCVQPPATEEIASMKPGAVLVGLLYAGRDAALLQTLCQQRITALAMENVPRISRAQSMDVLSSQATLAGYLAPLLGALSLPRILPMMTTAVGSLRAARVLVMGLGVAGLQALATAHRLGAVTEGYDVRPETREQAQSVGARFIDTGVDARGEGGYARELTAEEQAHAAAVLTEHIQQADMIITTANVPGRAAPKLISSSQIAGMKPGSVIVDLAAESGGNCEGTVCGQNVRLAGHLGGVTIVAPLNLVSTLAQHASELYGKNLLALLDLIVKDGALALDATDEVIAGTLLSHDGQIVNAAANAVLQAHVGSAQHEVAQ